MRRNVSAMAGLVEDPIAYELVHQLSNERHASLGEWWESLVPRLRKQVFNSTLHQFGEPPVHCEPWIMRRFIVRALESRAMLVIVSLSDILALRNEYRDPEAASMLVPDSPPPPPNASRGGGERRRMAQPQQQQQRSARRMTVSIEHLLLHDETLLQGDFRDLLSSHGRALKR